MERIMWEIEYWGEVAKHFFGGGLLVLAVILPTGGAIIGLLNGCTGSDEPKAYIPVHQVLVDGAPCDVELRQWCDDAEPCNLMSRTDAHWKVESDGRVKIMHVGQELRFERGTWQRSHVTDPQWVVDATGDYLLATTDSRHALIIHYPIDKEVK